MLALALLVARVRLADDHDTAVTADDTAVVANRLDAGVYLHDDSLFAVIVDRDTPGDVTSQRALLVAVGDPATGQVVRAQLDDHTVLREDPDVVLSHLARDVSEDLVPVGQLNAEHRVGQSFDHGSFDLDDTVFFGHSLFVAISIDSLVCGDLAPR